MSARERKPRVNVVQADGEEPVSRDVLAQHIARASAALRALTASGLNKRAVVILTSASSGVSRSDVARVIDSLEALESTYTAKAAKK